MFKVIDSDRLRRATGKALAENPSVGVLGYGMYEVDGRHGPYVVEVQLVGDTTEVHCQCLAGENGQPCYHAAAALRVHARQTAPAPTASLRRDRRLSAIAHDLTFIRRQLGEIEGSFEAVDNIAMALRSAFDALDEYELDLQPACEEIPTGVRHPRAA